MKRNLPPAFLIAFMACASPLRAQLPSLNVQPWFGHFVGVEGKRYQFGITSQGGMRLTPFNSKGAPIPIKQAISISVMIEEIQPDGKVAIRKIQPASLTSPQPATDKLEKTVITGKTSGDASFELTVEQDKGVISMGGRLLDAGKARNPLRFSIRAKFPDAYPRDSTTDKKSEKSFGKKIEDDRIDMKWTDGKRKKLGFAESVDAASKDVNGPGIAEAEIEIGSYKERKFVFATTENAMMTLANEGTAPLHKGFSIKWVPDPEKDKEGKARFRFEVK